MKKLYFFDFDGTLTHKDSMFLFLKFVNPSKYRIQFIKHLPLFVLLKLKLVEAETVKKSFVGSILTGKKKEKLEQLAQEFFDQSYPNLIRQNALDFIQNMDRVNTQSYMVTASLDIWTKPFADKFGMKLLATEAAYENDVFRGNFKTKNCNGREKLFRIKEEIVGIKYDKSIAFGDTSGDQQMLEWANENHYKFFH